MDNLPRLIFYLSGVVLISIAFTLFSSELLVKVADPSFTGTLFLLGFGLVYMNIIFVTSRRFMRRLEGSSNIPYLIALLVAAPPVIWVQIYDAGLGDSRLTFVITILLAAGLGAYFGHRAGLKAQAAFQESLQEYLDQSK